PIKQDPSIPPLTLHQQDSEFQSALVGQSNGQSDPRSVMIRLSNEFANATDNGFIEDPSANPAALKLLRLGTIIDNKEDVKAEELAPLTVAAEAVKLLGVDYAAYSKRQDWKNLKSNIRDSLIAIKFIQRGPSNELVSILRDMELIEHLVTNLTKPPSLHEFYMYRKRSPTFPAQLVVKPVQKPVQNPGPTFGTEARIQQTATVRHEQAIQILESRAKLDKAYIEIFGSSSALFATDKPSDMENLFPRSTSSSRKAMAEGLPDPRLSCLRSMSPPRRQAFTLSTNRLLEIVASSEKYVTARVGNAVVATPLPTATKLRSQILSDRVSKAEVMSLLNGLAALDSSNTPSKGKVYSVVADLIIVRQQLKGYESADVSSIQNVLKGETKKQEHTSTRRVEDSIFSEIETTSSIENEHSATSRYELGQETSAIIKEDLLAKGTLNASTYGPMYTVSASMVGSTSQNKERVNQTATKVFRHHLNGEGPHADSPQYSQDIVERTIKKITEKTLQRRITTVSTAQEIPTSIIAPPPFQISADQLNELNYNVQAHVYHTSGVAAPPERFVSAAAAASKQDIGGIGSDRTASDSGLIRIPDGYQAKSCVVKILTRETDKAERVAVSVGTWSELTQGEGVDQGTFALNGETGSVPW
ncbi:MAG: hypothetical protein Q9226_008602, partial [Calogaya cf. arnoldii]